MTVTLTLHSKCFLRTLTYIPTPTGSLVDLVVRTERPITREGIIAALSLAADGPMKGILSVTHEPLVSSDIVGDPHSCIVDASLVEVLDGRLLKIMAWYDNECGFANRMLDLSRRLGGTR